MTEEKIKNLAAKHLKDSNIVTKMIRYKTSIQNKLAETISEKQKNNLRIGKKDYTIVDSIINISKNTVINTDGTESNLFAISLAATVILKELDFFEYNTPKGQATIYNMLID
jgi:hypothetical protein